MLVKTTHGIISRFSSKDGRLQQWKVFVVAAALHFFHHHLKAPPPLLMDKWISSSTCVSQPTKLQ